jgi:Flp pilus assembly protein TadB
MGGALAEAFFLVFQMAICAVIAFAGGYMILSAVFARQISGREAFLLVAGLFVLMFICVKMMLYGGPGILVLLVVVAGTAALFTVLARTADRRLTKGLDDEETGRYERALEIDPDNVAAHALLADTYRRRGELERAIEEYEAALRLEPSLREESHWLERSKVELERQQSKELLCPRCRTPRPDGAGVCPECDREYSAWEVWRHSFEMMDQTRQATLTGVGVGAAGLLFAVVVLVPGATKLIGVVVFLLAPVAVYILTARTRGKVK